MEKTRYYIWKRYGLYGEIEYMTNKPGARYHTWGTKAEAHKFTYKQASGIIRVFDNNKHSGSAEVWSLERIL